MSSLSMGQSGSSSNNSILGDENTYFHFPADLVSPQDRKDEALSVLKSDVMASLWKEVKSLDEDSWMYAGPRSQIHLISVPGGFPYKRLETTKRRGSKSTFSDSLQLASLPLEE